MLVESISIILGCFWVRIRPIVWDKVPNWDMFCSPTFMNQVTIHYSYTKYCSPHLTNQNMFKKFCQFDWSNNSKIIRIRFFSPNNHESFTVHCAYPTTNREFSLCNWFRWKNKTFKTCLTSWILIFRCVNHRGRCCSISSIFSSF